MENLDLYKTISLDHLKRLTDCCGIIQHADHLLPSFRTGYTTDDNARALVVATMHHHLFGDKESQNLAVTYLAFLSYAQRTDGRFHNCFGFDRQPLDEVGSEDCFARTFAALAHQLRIPVHPDMAYPAERLLHEALPWIKLLTHPRSIALTASGLHCWWMARPLDRASSEALLRMLADRLVAHYEQHHTHEWEWLLPEMTYGNASLPIALFHAYDITQKQRYLDIALTTLEFLCKVTFRHGRLCLVGNNGWYSAEDDLPPQFDQQPIDATAMVEVCLTAYNTTGRDIYLERAIQALAWYFGANDQGLSLYDSTTGGCFDGLTETGVNRNRGAESTIALLQAQLMMLQAQRSYLLDEIRIEGYRQKIG